MPTRWFDIAGTVRWAKFNKPDTKYNEMGEYNVDFFPDSMEEFAKLGLERTPKTDEDGRQFVKLKRDNKRLIKGEIVEFGPPKLSIRVGKGKWEDFDGLIGNGSKVLLNICVFDTRKAPGHRIERVSIIDLVEYDPDKGATPEVYVPGPYTPPNDLDDYGDFPF